MKYLEIIYLALALCLMSCAKDDIKPYSADDAAVNFTTRSNSFSLKGMASDIIRLEIDVKATGPAVDYDREISLDIKDSTAVQGRDFTVVESVIHAGQLTGAVVLAVNKLSNDVGELAFPLMIKPNDHFRAGFPAYQRTVVKWTELYARPAEATWKWWFYFFCSGYSQELHRIIVEELGVVAEKAVQSSSLATSDPEKYTFKAPSWWYAASRQLREAVKEHDDANPDAPYMHSADYESYTRYTIPAGEGNKPEIIPTILSTLMNI